MHTIAASAPPRRIIRLPRLQERVPVHSSTLWRWEQDGRFPRRVVLGPNSIGWYEDEVDAWLSRRQQPIAVRVSPNPRAKARRQPAAVDDDAQAHVPGRPA